MTDIEEALAIYDGNSNYPYCDLVYKALRSQLTREQNEPLTCEELRGMDVPVWWVDCGQGAWAECNVEEYFKNFITVWFFGNECEDNIAFDRYGISYFAYRNKPDK